MIKERESIELGLSISQKQMEGNWVTLPYDEGERDYSVTFHTAVCQIIKRLNFKLAFVRIDPLVDDIDFVISNDKGLILRQNGKYNLNLNCKSAVKAIYDLCGFPKGVHRVRISDNLSKREDYLVYRILNEEDKR